MSSLVALVQAHGIIKWGQGSPADPDESVRALQVALRQAGYRVDPDGVFGDGTARALRRFQVQHRIAPADAEVGVQTAGELDRDHAELVAKADPQVVSVPTGGPAAGGSVTFPHDDTASLLAFYGRPWEDSSLLVPVPVPFVLRYHEDGGRVVDFTRIQFHRKAADRLAAALEAVWDWAGKDQGHLDGEHLSWFSGTYNYRAVRGSSRLSCHAFGAAVDLDAEDYPLGSTKKLPHEFVACFTAQGFFWGGDYAGRKDPMHFQSAHE